MTGHAHLPSIAIQAIQLDSTELSDVRTLHAMLPEVGGHLSHECIGRDKAENLRAAEISDCTVLVLIGERIKGNAHLLDGALDKEEINRPDSNKSFALPRW